MLLQEADDLSFPFLRLGRDGVLDEEGLDLLDIDLALFRIDLVLRLLIVIGDQLLRVALIIDPGVCPAETQPRHEGAEGIHDPLHHQLGGFLRD